MAAKPKYGYNRSGRRMSSSQFRKATKGHVMTARRKAALRKAQLASARKRRGRGKKRLSQGTRTALVLGGAALVDRGINHSSAKAFGYKKPKPNALNRAILYGSAAYLAGRGYNKLRKNRKKRKK